VDGRAGRQDGIRCEWECKDIRFYLRSLSPRLRVSQYSTYRPAGLVFEGEGPCVHLGK
jgi:hypothetical protein